MTGDKAQARCAPVIFHGDGTVRYATAEELTVLEGARVESIYAAGHRGHLIATIIGRSYGLVSAVLRDRLRRVA